MPASQVARKERWLAAGTLVLLALCLPILLGFGLPGEFGRLLDAGNKAYSRGDYRRAATRYGNALEVTPESPEALFNRGAARYRSDDFDAALEDFAKATRGATGTLKQYAEYNAGNCDYRMQRYDDAIERYKRALTLDPDDTWAKHNLEMALRAKQQEDQQDKQQKQDEQKQDEQKQDEQKQDEQKQDQQKQDEQKQDQQKQDQQKQDQQKQDQQKQDQQKQDQQKQDEQKQDQQKQDQQEQGAPDSRQDQAQAMTPEQAAQLLGSLAREDASLQKLMRRAPMTPEKPTDKDW